METKKRLSIIMKLEEIKQAKKRRAELYVEYDKLFYSERGTDMKNKSSIFKEIQKLNDKVYELEVELYEIMEENNND